MKKILFFLTFTLFMGVFSANTYAISAQSAAVIDATSGRVLYEHNANERRGMASTTKIMTALCALEYGDMNKTVTISPTASGVEGSSMYLSKNEKISMTDLVYGLMLVSGNDAATAIAESVSGSVEKFAELMNKKASEIGALNTSFTNPHGLSDKNHYTTAYDLAKITAYAMQNPKFCEIVSTKTKNLPATEGGYARRLVNHNKFLSMYDGCIGVKTGFTKATGRCLVTAVEKDGLKLVCVTLNAYDDWDDHKELYNTAFEKYKPLVVKKSGEKITDAKIKNGESESITLTPKSDVIIPISQGEENKIEITPQSYEDLCAPIRKGDVLGKLDVKINGKLCGEFPLVANCDIKEKKVIFKNKPLGFSRTFKRVFIAWLTCFQ